MTGMVTDKTWVIDADTLVARPVSRARMLVVEESYGPGAASFGTLGQAHAVVLDADTDEFVLVPHLPKVRAVTYMSLSDDGTRLVGIAEGPRLFVLTLATGQTRWFNRDDIDGHVMGTFSPDGSCLAALAMVEIDMAPGVDEHRIAIEIINLDTGAVRTIWQDEGYWDECSLSWSPGGRLLAASYMTLDEVAITIVLDTATARVLTTHEDRIPAENPHEVWITEYELVAVARVDDGVAIIHVDAGAGTSHERLYRQGIPEGFLSASDRRFVSAAVYPEGSDITELYTARLDGSDRQLLLRISSKVGIRAVDIPRTSSREP